MLDSTGGLSVAELAFFAPALLVSIFVLIRHGCSRQLGWFYLVVLSILRLIGASCLVYAEVQHDDDPSLLHVAAITSSVGLGPLLLATMGFLERINQGMEQKGLSLSLFRLLHLLSLGALIIAIVGGSDISETDSNEATTGQNLLEASSILFLAIYLGLAAIAVMNAVNKRWVLPAERTLLLMVVLALPFIFVRVLYTILVSFSKAGSAFAFSDPDVWAQAFMRFLMEAIVVVMFIVAGLITPKSETRASATGSKHEEGFDLHAETHGQNTSVGLQGNHGEVPQSAPYQPKRLANYRPSRLIMSALQGRR